MTQKSISVDIEKFSGDPETLPFFIQQVKSICSINKYTDEAAATFMKSKLSGPALKFLTQRSDLCQCKDTDILEKELKDFFAPSSKTQNIIELNNILLQPAETIRNFSHRLNILVASAYSDIKDVAALDNIKFLKFISSIPSQLRIKIQEEKISDYVIAVARAQELQDILNSEKLLTTNNVISIDTNFNETLKQINEKLHLLELKQNSTHDQQTKHENESAQNVRSPCKKPLRHFKSKHTFKRFSPHKNFRKPIVTCQICNYRGHDAQRCFKFKRLNEHYNRNKFSRNDNFSQNSNFHTESQEN